MTRQVGTVPDGFRKDGASYRLIADPNVGVVCTERYASGKAKRWERATWSDREGCWTVDDDYARSRTLRDKAADVRSDYERDKAADNG
jgi:hypothetical protein